MTMMPTMANPSYGQSSGGAGQSSSTVSGRTTINGGPGPVDGGGNTNNVSGYSTTSMPMSMSMSMSAAAWPNLHPQETTPAASA